MSQGSQGLGYHSTVFTGNTTGTLLGATGAATSLATRKLQGLFHEVTIGVDTSATTITVYDATSATGTPIWEVTTGAAPTAPVTLRADIQAMTGLYIVISGATAPTITVTYI